MCQYDLLTRHWTFLFDKSHMIFSTNRRLRNIQKCRLLDRDLRLHWPWTCFEIVLKTLAAKTRWLCAAQVPVCCNNTRQLDLAAYFNKNKNKKSSAIKLACSFLYRKNENTEIEFWRYISELGGCYATPVNPPVLRPCQCLSVGYVAAPLPTLM